MDFFTHVKKNKFTREALILIILLWLLLAYVIGVSGVYYYNLYYDSQHEANRYIIEPYIKDFEEIVLNLDGYLKGSEEVTAEEFHNYCSGICDTEEGLNIVAVAPLGVIAYTYPESKEIDFVGIDILAQFNALELAKFQYAMEHDELFITYKDDQTLTLHKPVVKDDLFVGLVCIQLDIDEIATELTRTLQNNDVVLYTEESRFILGDNDVNLEHYNVYEIDISGVTFYAGNNYFSSSYYRTFAIVSAIEIGLLLSLATIFFLLYKNQKGLAEFVNQMDYTFHHDADTELRNKRALYEDFQHILKEQKTFYIAYGVFNNIKYINYKYGHKMGNNVVNAAISLIQGVLRNHIEMYHLGGDEYAFVFQIENENEVRNILGRILRVFEREIVIKRVRTNISLSLGVVNYPKEGKTIDELIRNAHLTLMQSNIINSNNFAFFSPNAITSMITNQDFDDFVTKLDLHLFHLYLMPIADCKTNRIVGFECLSRPFNEFDEMLDTEMVVTSLERNGRIQELDEIVFSKVLAYMQDIDKQFPDNDLFLSVNASALSFNDNYVDNIIEAFEKSKVHRGKIILELTEGYKVEDHDYLIRLFNRLNKAGIRSAIDDFGSGYSSLSYISKFPIYSIKVDKMYVRDYYENNFNRTLFLTLRSIAEVLDCKLVAEGVDDPETLDFLRENDCEWYQGFLFSKGVPYTEAVKMIENNKSKSKE